MLLQTTSGVIEELNAWERFDGFSRETWMGSASNTSLAFVIISKQIGHMVLHVHMVAKKQSENLALEPPHGCQKIERT